MLQTLAAAKSIIVNANADIVSGSGPITVLSGKDITFNSAADLTSTGTGTLDIEATNGAISLSGTSHQTTGSGDIRFWAKTNITLGGTATTTGHMSATADTGWIRDADTDNSVDIEANGLRLQAAVGVGELGQATANAIETTVTTVSATSGSEGINLLESDDLVIADTTVTVKRVAADATTSDTTDAAQSIHRVARVHSLTL